MNALTSALSVPARPAGSLLSPPLPRGKHRWLRSLLGLWFLSLWSCLALGAGAPATTGIELEWDPNTEPDVIGYKLYYGTVSGTYLNALDAGSSTTTTVPDLIAGFTYYFVVTAYSADGLESLPSNEVTTMVSWPPSLRVTYLPRESDPDGIPNPIEIRNFARAASGRMALTISGAERTAVTVYGSADMQTWQELGTITNPTGQIILEDLAAGGEMKRFYRLKQFEVPVTED